MLKNRVIPIQLLSENRLVKSVQFENFRDVGDPVKSSAVYNSQDADELIFLDVDRERHDTSLLVETLRAVSEVCFMPLAVGGGIRHFEQAAELIREGADKLVLNSVVYQVPTLINEIANVYGSQAVIVAVDVRRKSNGSYVCYSDCGRKQETISLDEHLNQIVRQGAGEILIQSIDQDGVMNGLDMLLMKHVSEHVNIPLIGCGGIGNYQHLKDIFVETDIKAVACASIFNFSDSNLHRAKACLKNYGLPFKAV